MSESNKQAEYEFELQCYEEERAMSEEKPRCDICGREHAGVAWMRIMSEEPCYACKACRAIWYDGCTDGEEIKRHSLHWPVDDVSAYAKSHYDNEPEMVIQTPTETVPKA